MIEQERLSNDYSDLKEKHVNLKDRHRQAKGLLQAMESKNLELNRRNMDLELQLEIAESELLKLRTALLHSRQEVDLLRRGVSENLHINMCEKILSAHNLLGKLKTFNANRYVNLSRFERLRKERDFYKGLVRAEDHEEFAAREAANRKNPPALISKVIG